MLAFIPCHLYNSTVSLHGCSLRKIDGELWLFSQLVVTLLLSMSKKREDCSYRNELELVLIYIFKK